MRWRHTGGRPPARQKVLQQGIVAAVQRRYDMYGGLPRQFPASCKSHMLQCALHAATARAIGHLTLGRTLKTRPEVACGRSQESATPAWPCSVVCRAAAALQSGAEKRCTPCTRIDEAEQGTFACVRIPQVHCLAVSKHSRACLRDTLPRPPRLAVSSCWMACSAIHHSTSEATISHTACLVPQPPAAHCTAQAHIGCVGRKHTWHNTA